MIRFLLAWLSASPADRHRIAARRLVRRARRLVQRAGILERRAEWHGHTARALDVMRAKPWARPPPPPGRVTASRPKGR